MKPKGCHLQAQFELVGFMKRTSESGHGHILLLWASCNFHLSVQRGRWVWILWFAASLGRKSVQWALGIFMGLYKEEPPQVKSTGAVIAQGCKPHQCSSTINQNKQWKCQKG